MDRDRTSFVWFPAWSWVWRAGALLEALEPDLNDWPRDDDLRGPSARQAAQATQALAALLTTAAQQEALGALLAAQRAVENATAAYVVQRVLSALRQWATAGGPGLPAADALLRAWGGHAWRWGTGALPPPGPADPPGPTAGGSEDSAS